MEQRVSPWEVFMEERPEVVKAYQEMMRHVNKNNVLDKKTMALIYVGIVMSASQLTSAHSGSR
jgi:alkylhydroperoxidase/carboxymuconolactone decarboxylase family protein YurZ